MLEEERRNNLALRVSIDNLKQLLEGLKKGEVPSNEDIELYQKDLNRIVESITNYHSRFKEVLETINHIKELSLPTELE